MGISMESEFTFNLYLLHKYFMYNAFSRKLQDGTNQTLVVAVTMVNQSYMNQALRQPQNRHIMGGINIHCNMNVMKVSFSKGLNVLL